MTQVSALRSTPELLLELSGKGHPLPLRSPSLELLVASSATTGDSLPEDEAIMKESRVRDRDRFLVTLFKHLDPAVPEVIPEIYSSTFPLHGPINLLFC